MAFFADNFVERVRAASDIVEVIGASLPLKRAGANFVTLCPFHREKSPSFNVNPHRQIFHCFGCHKGGDVFRFVQDYENVTFPEAVERLAERARIPLEFQGGRGESSGQRGQRDLLLKLHEAICTRWQSCLASEAAGESAREYVARRGLTEAALREFRVGAAPDAWDDTVNWAKAKGFDAGVVEQAGLIIRGEKGYYDRFRGRLMFPICDEQGRVIAFSGRVIRGDEKTAKYVNSPETPLFTKGRVLFALDKAKRAILDAGHAVVCEGQLDTIACHVAGIRHVVAPQGTALTPEHARILKRYVNEVVLCFDGDAAGRKAAIRSLDDLLASGLSVRVATIPPPDDPDSYLRQHGADALRGILTAAKGFFDFYIGVLQSENDLSTDRGRQAMVKALGDAAFKTGNDIVIEDCARKCAGVLGLSPLTALQQFRTMYAAAQRRGGAAPASPSPEAVVPPKPPAVRPGANELWLLKFLVQANPDLRAWALDHLDLNWLIHAGARRIASECLAHAPHDATAGGTDWLRALEDDEDVRILATEVAGDGREIPELAVQLRQTVTRIRDAWIDRQVALLNATLTDSRLPEEQRLRAMAQQQELRAWRRQPLSPLAGS